MNSLILNRETFQMPEDGWYQIAPLGEFPHEATSSAGSGQAGIVQVIDEAACTAMVSASTDRYLV
jgi:hypothetical protein